jgi:antirestriction protein ArdC
MSEFRDVWSRITDKIVADLEQGVCPWNAEHAAGGIIRPLRHNGIPRRRAMMNGPTRNQGRFPAQVG